MRRGQLLITLSEAADDQLYLWAKTAHLTKGGQVIFQTDLGISVLRLNFTNAYCVELTRNIDAQTGTQTILVISPESIDINGTEHNNFWK